MRANLKIFLTWNKIAIYTLNPTLRCLLIKVKLGRSMRGMSYAINEFRFDFIFLLFARSFASEFN